MKAVDITENSSIIVKEVNEPSIGSGDVLIRLNGCGICGTDKENLDGDSSKPSTKLGHEICGTVLKKGQNVNAEISEGMRVLFTITLIVMNAIIVYMEIIQCVKNIKIV